MDEVLGYKDNIDPAILLNSGTNWSDFSSIMQEDISDNPLLNVVNDEELAAVDPHLTGQSKKRKQPDTLTSSEAMIEVLCKKWKEDQEERERVRLRPKKRTKKRKNDK